jgi:hypothetical protein
MIAVFRLHVTTASRQQKGAQYIMDYSHRVRRACAVVASLICIGTCGLLAQAGEQEASPGQNSLERGSWAFQFQIANNFTLREFQGAVISAKKHFSENTAVRMGVSVVLNGTDEDVAGTSFQYDTVSSRNTGDASRDGQTFQVNAQYLYYPNPHSAVNFFLGGGPLIVFSRSHSESEQSSRSPSGYVSTQTNSSNGKSWAIGAGAVTGVEWFATRNLSFHAEYGVTIQYQWLDVSDASRYTSRPPTGPVYSSGSSNESSRNFWQFNGTTVKFGLSVYF